MNPSKQKILVRVVAVIVILMILIVGYLFTTSVFEALNYKEKQSQIEAQVPQQPQVGTAEEYLGYINAERAKVQAPPLTIDPILNNTAKIKADDMVARNYYVHNGPDGSKWDIILRSNGKPTQALGENLAECYMTTFKTIEGWKGSPGHFRTLLDETYKFYGSYAEINPKDGCLVVVNHFSS